VGGTSADVIWKKNKKRVRKKGENVKKGKEGSKWKEKSRKGKGKEKLGRKCKINME
jgi:hypothetical protein